MGSFQGYVKANYIHSLVFLDSGIIKKIMWVITQKWKEPNSLHWNTLREPFGPQMGNIANGQLKLIGRRSLASSFDVSMVASRWQPFNFTAETKVKFTPFSYQQMAGLVNYYNDKHWSWIFITYDEQKDRVIEIAENNRGKYRSYLVSPE